MKHLCIAAALLLAAAPGRADDTTAGDFAYGIELQPSAAQPIHAFTLQERVLRALTDRELGDLCVFDAAGVQRPHALHTERDTARAPVELAAALFPLEASPPHTSDGVEVRVERDPNGNITRAFSKQVASPQQPRVGGYLVDVSAIADPIIALTLAISSPRDYTLELEVDESDDLNTFRPVTRATLAHLEHEGRSLDHDLIELTDHVHARYLRLRFDRQVDDLRIAAVRVRALRPVQASPRRTLELTARAPTSAEPPVRQEPTRAGQSFSYAVAGVFTFDRYSVVLPAETPLVEGSLLSAPRAEGPFRELDRALFRQPPTERTLMPSGHGFFELRVSDKGGGIRAGEPTLRLGYLAPQLLFASNDSATYTLAYGSARKRCKRFDEEELATLAGSDQGLPRPDSVQAVRVKTLAGAAVLEPAATPRPWRVYALWAVLLAAVGGLAAVARSLVKKA